MKKINIILLRSSLRRSKVLFGAETIILTIAERIDKTKFNPLIVVFKGEDEEIPPLALEAKQKKIPVEIIILKGKFDFFSIFKLRRIILKNNIDILHSHEYKSDIIAFIATRFTSVKLITTTHGWLSINPKVKFYEFLDSIVIRFFNKIVAVSNAMEKELLKIKIPSSKTSVIETALDFSYLQLDLKKSNLREELGFDSNAVLIGTIGRLSLERGHIYFLRAAKEIIKIFPNVIFLIAGDGYLKESLVSEAKKMGIKDKVFFLGFRKDISNILSAIDIFVFPSLRESFGIALVEAMAVGKPVVATRMGISSEIIKDGETGIMIEPKNSDSIREAVIKLLRDENLRVKIGASAKRLVVERFNCQQMVNSYEYAYLALLEKQKNTGSLIGSKLC